MNRIVDKPACTMCLATIQSSHLATFYALGRKQVDLNVCADHETAIQTAVASVDRRFTGPPPTPWWRKLFGGAS